jgi:hypothetical protein
MALSIEALFVRSRQAECEQKSIHIIHRNPQPTRARRLHPRRDFTRCALRARAFDEQREKTLAQAVAMA